MSDQPSSAPQRPLLAPDQLQVQAWMNSPAVRIYTNGFGIAQTNADISVIMLLNGMPTAIANMSFISAKSLMEELQKAIKVLEDALGQPVPSMGDVAAKLIKAHGPSHG